MAININTKELLELLETTPASQNIMLSGKHGIGKSKIITDHYESKGLKVVTLFLCQPSIHYISGTSVYQNGIFCTVCHV